MRDERQETGNSTSEPGRRNRGTREQGTKVLRDEGTKGRKDQGTKGSRNKRTMLAATFALVLGVASSSQARAAPPSVLDPVVVSATRSAESVIRIGSAVDSIDGAELARRQSTSLAAALGSVPGAPVLASGMPGAASSLFLRGANSNQTLFLVDGIRFNDPNTDYAVWLGGTCIGACDSLEISHGPQSTLYGGEAVGGVISLRSRRGMGSPHGTATVEAGAFDTVQGAVSAEAGDALKAWSFSAAGGHTDNDRPNNAFDSATYSLRVDRRLNDAVAIGATVRGFNGCYGSPGTRFTNDPDNEERESNQLATVFAEFGNESSVRSRVIVGGQDRRFVSDNPGPSGAQITLVKNRRAVLDWQSTWRASEAHRITGGVTGEINHARNTGLGDINARQRLLAVFVEDQWSPTENVFLTGGLRSDDHDTFGRATTGRVTGAWLLAGHALKLRASYGTAFRSPAFLDLYGQSSFYVGNPDLEPEKARGWDAGLDAYLPGRRGTLSVTWFDTRLTDLIVFDFGVFPGTTANVERARTHGVELSGRLLLPGGIHATVAATWLEADNETDGTRLLRRPRYSGSCDLWREFNGSLSIGVGGVFAAQREDVHAATFATIDAEDYTVARLYGAWRLGAKLTLRARVENTLDESYEQVHGYPQPGRSAYAGLEWTF